MGDPQDLRERAVGALLAVVALALVIGGVIGAVAYGAVRVAGIGGDPSPASAESTPSGSGNAGGASPAASASPQPAATSSPAAGQHAQSKPSPRHRHHHHHRRHRHHQTRAGAPSLTATPGHVSPMGRIDMSGRYPGHAGASLQVQQRVGGGYWQDFPVTVTVRGGGFHTWVASGRRGLNRFRVVDRASGRASAPVSVMVG